MYATPVQSRIRALRRRAAAPILLLACAACRSYPSRTSDALGDFRSGHLSRALEAYEDPETTNTPFLRGAEAGTVALAAGRWDDAVLNLGRAVAAVEDADNRAVVSAESLGEMLLTWTLSEGATRYRGEGYERVLVHAGLALAYLAQGNVEDAHVEVRRSNALLESEEKLYKKKYKAGGLGHFVSAVAYELDGKLDDAYIDYRRMVDKGVGMGLAGRALVRLAASTDRRSDLERWEKRFGKDFDRPEGAASVVVIAGVGLGPYKREHQLDIPTKEGLLQWSVPSFVRRPQPVGDLEISVAGGDQPVRTIVVEDVGRVARENLEDRIAWLAAKSAVRAVIKRELTHKLQDQAGVLGRIAGDVFTIVTEHADLRSWETLPDTWQAARVFVPAGAHELSISARGGERKTLGTFELGEGETMLVLARTVETKLYAYPIGGRRVDSSAGAATP